MTRDFGPWKKDQRLILTFDFENGDVSEYDTEGALVIRIAMCIAPVEYVP